MIFFKKKKKKKKKKLKCKRKRKIKKMNKRSGFKDGNGNERFSG
jgi:hypothetical protein